MNLSNVIVLDTQANRPLASVAGRLFFSSDTLKVYRDNGASWDDATPAPALSTEILRDVAASKPAAGAAGRLFFASDTLHIYRDNGASWDDVTPTGTGSILDGGGAKTTGDAAKFDATGKLVDAGAPAVLDGGGAKTTGHMALYDATGKLVDGGVPPSAGVAAGRNINTTAPLTGGGDLSADRTLAISNFSGDAGAGGAKGAVPAPAAGDAAAGKVLGAGGAWVAPAAGGMTPVRSATAPSSPMMGQIWLDSTDTSNDVRKIWQTLGGTAQWVAF